MEDQKSKPTQTPDEATTVGMFLKYTRLNQKKSVEQVAKTLCIRKTYIKAIEESNFAELPPIPYGVGFVRSYAALLGLNSERIVQCYKEEALPKKFSSEVKDASPRQKSPMINMPSRVQILAGLVAVIIIYAVWLLISFNSKDSTPVSTTEETPQTISEEILEPQASEEIEVETAETSEPQENGDEQIKILDSSYPEEIPAPAKPENRVKVKLTGDSWLEIRDSDKVYISGIFKKGYEYTLPDVKGLIFSAGRYYNVEVYIDGKLTKVATPRRQTKIRLDPFLNH